MAKEVFKAKVNWKKGLVCIADARGFQLTMDEPAYLGGTDLSMNPVEVLLSALGGCLTISAAAFAPACKVNLLDVSVEVEGIWIWMAFWGGIQRCVRFFPYSLSTAHQVGFTCRQCGKTGQDD